MTATEKVLGPRVPRVFPGQQPFYPPLAPVQRNRLTAQEGSLSCPAFSPRESRVCPELQCTYHLHSLFFIDIEWKNVLMNRAVVGIMS